MAARVSPQPSEIRRASWPEVRRKINSTWDLNDNPHHSIFAQTRAGKTYLVVNGILPLCERDRVLIIDVKGDDRTLAATGKPILSLPKRRFWHVEEDKPREHWYRLVVHDDREDGKAQVAKALDQVYAEGNWIVYVDEMRTLTDPQDPNLGVKSRVERLWLKGASRDIGVIGGTQAPRWVPGAMYDQAAWAWIGRVRDAQAQKRLMEFGGLSRDQLPQIAEIHKHDWLLCAEGGDYTVMTKVE